jgi:hypothetical protein
MTIPVPSEPEPAQARWFRDLGRKVNEDYMRLHQAALKDPQRAGHGGESTWADVLRDWLPSAYEVVTRKYIVPEIGDEKFETDIIVINPSYPKPLRGDEEILAGGVAAAFSVKLTLDSAGIRDGIKRAVALRRALQPRIGTPRHEMVAPFPVGILAHSHDWKLPGSTPAKNISDWLWQLDHEFVLHPRESLDYLCVSDLAMWSVMRVPYMPAWAVSLNPSATERQQHEGAAYTSISQTDPNQTFNAIASLITHLLVRLSYLDSTIRPLADNLELTGTLGIGGGPTRVWSLDGVFSETVRNQWPYRGFQDKGSDWCSVIY